MAFAFDQTTNDLPLLDIRNLPKGVIWTTDTRSMGELRMQPGVQLVMAPFDFSSGARKAINSMCLTPLMHQMKAQRNADGGQEGDRYRPDYWDVGPSANALEVAANQVHRAFTINKYTPYLIDDVARAVEIFQGMFADNTVGMRIEAQGLRFQGFRHLDTSRAGATIQFNGNPMTVCLRDQSQRRSPLTWYRMPRCIATWHGAKGDTDVHPPLMHEHGTINLAEIKRSDRPADEPAWRAIFSVLQS